MSIKPLLSVLTVLMLVSLAVGQDSVVRPPDEPRRVLPPPVLMVRLPEGDRSVPMRLAKLDVRARIVGCIAETRMTMTFANPNNRALAGDLYFPLPEGATISGYALDINGMMVDGVVVEKDRGRQVFESIVRQGIDPGLVEWSKGNNFRTRVFPIPANGTRTIRVDYVSDLAPAAPLALRKLGDAEEAAPGAVYLLPLNFKDKVGEVSLKIQVARPGAEPKIVTDGGLANFKFDKWAALDGFQAETALKDAALTGDLRIALPAVEKQPVQVEKAADGQVYFCINDFPKPPAADGDAKAKLPRRVTILWDASGSRLPQGGKDYKRELGLLKDYIAKFKGQMVTFELIFFRDKAAEPVRFDVETGQCPSLLGKIEEVAYDGGTQLGAISPQAGRAAWQDADLYLLFTDGISNFGKEEPAGFKHPVHAICGDATANHAMLRYIASTSGGTYFNLNRMDDPAVLAGLTASQPFSFLSTDADKLQFAGVYPRLAQAVQGEGGRFTVVGKLLGDEGAIAINYGRGGKTESTSKFTVRKADAIEGQLLRRFWASQKVAELMIFQGRNEEDIVTTGKQYGLVTPFTSLIVLDNLQQYLQHGITPPESLPEMRKQYDAQIATIKAEKEKTEKAKIDHVLALWDTRVKWWEKEFMYPKDFRFAEKVAKGAVGGRGTAGDDDGRVREGLALGPGRPSAPSGRPATPAATPPPPPSTGTPPRVARSAGPDANFATFDDVGDSMSKDGKSANERTVEPGVVIKPWDPQTPYLVALKAVLQAKDANLFKVYMEQRKTHGNSPAFFFDVANWLFSQKKPELAALATQVLSNIAELELENAALLRVLGYKLAEVDQLDLAIDTFEKVKKLRPEEPQSHRDLALLLIRRADSTRELTSLGMREELAGQLKQRVYDDYKRAADLLAHVVMNKWDRFDEIEVIALMELNAMLPKAKAAGLTDIPVDARLVKLLDVDVRIVMTWDADLTDIDLHVVEPSGERAFYGHNRTTIGGAVSHDFTQGYGPEEYTLRRAMAAHGTYKIQVNYYGSTAQTVQGPVTLMVDVYTNYGRPNEKRRSLVLRLSERKETVDVGEMEF